MSIQVSQDLGVLIVEIHRPGAMNALGDAELRGLLDAIAHASDPTVRAVVLTGWGAAFCAGIDVKAAIEPSFMRGVLRDRLHPIVLGLVGLEKPLVVAVNGVAAGAGVSLALAGDVRLGGASCSFVPAFADLGLSPDTGLTHLAVRAMGYSDAVRFVLGGRRWGAGEALRSRLLDQVVEDEVLRETALLTARNLAGAPGATVAATLRLLRSGSVATLAAQLEDEARAQHALLASLEIREAMEARMRAITERSTRGE
ncbi:enoyl-CoA hydratase/isomerase family protein [Microbacterium sp. CPCC 204701]|uniref:enoyl-CoA hydratase/isomerase family protein n=1 Tax=Microbacterium sp. CPCC 204701 TaxID=2493084 RepID=UPI000FDA1005|nr:enoyl-CoA hydratase-related protein [Microbacterium sp. CPCC 204701]